MADREGRNRLQRYITNAFNEYLGRHRLNMAANNDLVEVRNRLFQSITALFAELDTKARYGLDIDYLHSDIPRVNLSQAECPYWLKGSIPVERPPGPTNEEIDTLIAKVRAALFKEKEIPSSVAQQLETQIVYEVRTTFVIPNSNLPYTTRLYDRTRHFPWDMKQNTPCDICGENRAIDTCHILPAAYGGSANTCNTLYLCPTHHRLFDRFMLTRDEWESLDFSRKSKVAANYAYHVLRPQMQVFWGRLSDERYVKRGTYDHGITEDQITAVGEELTEEVWSLIQSNPGTRLDEIERATAANSKQVRRMVSALRRQGRVSERRKNGERRFYPMPDAANAMDTR